MSSTAPHQAIYRRWRAQTFGQIVGQGPVVETLRNAVRSGRSSQAYLFVGPRGTGKTSMARILAKALNCTDLRDGEPCDRCPSCVAIREGRALDVSELDAASNNRVDDIRDLLPRIYTAPSDLRRKVFIVDEVQRIREGWDVLLKTLEEPPEHVVFVFCTTDSSQIRPAVLSRVQRFDFRKLTVGEIGGKLRTILEADGREAEPAAVDLIARLAAGGMRDAESMLDQLLSPDGGALTADRVREVLGLVEEETVAAFLGALVRGDAVLGIELLDGLEERGRDLRAFTEQAVEGLRSALVESLGRRPDGGLAALGPAALAAAARRLSAIDPAHAGPGGLRLQLDLALLAPGEAVPAGIAPAAEARGAPMAAVPPAARSERTSAESAAPERTPPERTRRSEPTRPQEPPRPERPRPEPVRPEAARPAPAARTAPAESPAAAPAAAATSEPASPTAAAKRESGPAAPGEAPAAAGRAASVDRGPAGGPAPAAGPDPTLALLLERWAEVVAVISKHPPTKPLIEACRPIGVEGAVVTLGFPETQAFLKQVAERRRAILEDGVSRVLGIPVSVRVVATNVEIAPLSENPDEARLLKEFRRIYGDDAADVGEVD